MRLATFSLLLVPAAIVACGSSNASSSSSSSTGAGSGGGAASSTSMSSSSSGGASTSGAPTSTGAFSTGSAGACDPACGAGQFCSAVTNMCIDQGTCAGDADCTDAGTVCDSKSHTCVPGGCDSQEIPTAPVAPNLLIVIDRSCSMNQPPDKGGTDSKWTIATNAIDDMLSTFKGQIRFGITMFPEPFTMKANDCLQIAPIPVPVGADNEDAVSALLTNPSYLPGDPCVTNIDTGMAQAATDPGLADATRGDYVVLMTDGAQSSSCGGTGADMNTVATITALAMKGVHTFVVGFGGAVNQMSLTEFADAGGEVNPNAPPDYFDAEDQASLMAVFQAIAAKTIGCDFQLDKPPQDPNQLYAFFDDVSVPRDTTHMDGWDYDASTDQVIFYGASCEELQQGKVTKVDVVYGCDAPPK